MVNVKMLRPYYIKADDKYVRVILAYQYFSVFVNNQVYQFVPVDAKEICVNRYTHKIENIHDTFAFQKGKEILKISMTDLISLPDFLAQLHAITEPYYIKEVFEELENGNAVIIDELEQMNLKRLIDKALDERDEEAFYALVTLL
ncbi:IDEAL domain-containing protein [Oceanobacillus halotolerans]|uniref:IDEAL domain-containing protein n=1 Tax=Oceanobacillus halotolerans TaxID=2663380 RepID=UPI0013DD0C88|nr:IDEAL domain-containing protein [Oceanobacillus halotolerans]